MPNVVQRSPGLARADRLELARDAQARAQAFLAAGKRAEAHRWADRAHRLLPADDTLALTLASACLGLDDTLAATLFTRQTTRYDIREAWVGLAIARRNQGDLGSARAAVHSALSRHVPDNNLSQIADALLRQLGLPGWCEVTLDGMLQVHLSGDGQRVELEIDGVWHRHMTGGRFRIPVTRWKAAHRIGLTCAGVHLLGSPIEAAQIRRMDGCVATRDGAIEGWAWHPADPATDPVITVVAPSGRRRMLIAQDEANLGTPVRPLGRYRRIFISRNDLTGLSGLLHVCSGDGHDLMGSPLDPFAEQRLAARSSKIVRDVLARQTVLTMPSLPLAVPADISGPTPPVGVESRHRTVDVIIAVHGGDMMTRACLDSVLATVMRPSRIIVVDDASPDPDLAGHLKDLARRRKIDLICHPRRLGYTASANSGIRAATNRDVVLLNSDTLVPPGWLDRLRKVAYGAPDIGTVSPFSSNGTLLSYPRRDEANPMPDCSETKRIGAWAWRANGDTAIDLPVTVGFCLYVRRDCLNAVGLLREDVFAQGYGEENDFCLRARHLGWRHVAAPGVYVAHHGGLSFGATGEVLRARNQVLLNRMYPGYEELILAHYRKDPLASARRKLDLARWRGARLARRPTTLLITHDAGGGVEHCVAAACSTHIAAGRRPVVLKPSSDPDGTSYVRVSDGLEDAYPNLRFALPRERAALARFLMQMKPRGIEVHHTFGYHPVIHDLISDLGSPVDIHVHDYALICPRITLIGRERRYCGEPTLATCEGCLADLGSYAEDNISVEGLRQRSRNILTHARRIVVPSLDAAKRLQGYFPSVQPDVRPHEDDVALAATPLHAGIPGDTTRICVVGAIGIDKGFEILLACARDAVERALPLEFVVVGHTIDDGRLLDTGRVFITGEYRPDEVVPLIRAQHADLAWVPSLWPETWCFTLSEAWRAGLRVAAFDLGAQAERVRRSGRGVVLPLGLPAGAINSALLAAAGLSGHQ
jgi:GT2 family glycosyltransferase